VSLRDPAFGIISLSARDVDAAWPTSYQRPQRSASKSPVGIRRPTRRSAGRVSERLSDGTQWMDFKAIRRTDRNVVMGVASGWQALADSGPRAGRQPGRDDIGVIFGSGGGGPYLLMENVEKGEKSGAMHSFPFFIANMLPSTRPPARSPRSRPGSAVRTCASTPLYLMGTAIPTMARPPRASVVAITSRPRWRDREPGLNEPQKRNIGFEHVRHGPLRPARLCGDRFATVRQDA